MKVYHGIRKVYHGVRKVWAELGGPGEPGESPQESVTNRKTDKQTTNEAIIESFQIG